MRKYSYKTFITILWSFLTLMTLIPIYWMVLVSTKTPVELFGKPDLSPTFFDKIYWKNYTRPFIDGVYSEYVTPRSWFVVPEVLEVHVVPSEEVRRVPDAPTATNVLFP